MFRLKKVEEKMDANALVGLLYVDIGGGRGGGLNPVASHEYLPRPSRETHQIAIS